MPGKTLVFVPTYKVNGVKQIRPETEASVRALTGNKQIVWSCDNPYPLTSKLNGELNILHQFNMARDMVLASDEFDALLIIEHDMVVPPDALEKLASDPADIVYGIYIFRHGGHVLNAFRKTCEPRPDQSLTHFKHIFPHLLQNAWKSGRIEVSGAGTGCTLIKRRVLEVQPFRIWENTAPDIPMAVDALANGFTQVARFDVICGHFTSEGVLLTPSPED